MKKPIIYHRRSFLAVVFLSTLAVDARADATWQAQWIGLPEATSQDKQGMPHPNLWICFRKNFQLESVPTEATTQIACDSKYWLWINGKLVIFEGQLKRGPTPDDTYFDSVDLAPHFQEGENCIALLLWYFGKQGFSHKDSGKPGLIFQADLGESMLESDATWKVSRHPAYGNTGPPHPNYRLPESNIRFEAGADIPDWQQIDFDDSSWQTAEEFGTPPCLPWGNLFERPIPQFRKSKLRDYENTAELTSPAGIKTIYARLPYNAQITPYLKVDAPAGQVIDIRTDNYRGGGEYNVRAEYVTKQGVQEFESFGWMNGHEVEYRVPPGVEVIDLKYRESGYDCDFAGLFECDDPFLNRLRTKALRTLYVEMRDGFFDCPGRERAQWWGDITLALQQAFYSLDRKSDLLFRKAICELVDWRKPDGTLFSPIPAGNWDKELPMQMLASVGKYGFWTYYLHTGDRATIERVYPAVREYVLDVWQLGNDGLVVQRTGAWTWGDWGENKDLPLLYNTWYYLALDSVRLMAELVGEQADQREAESRMTSIRERFNATYWNGKEYRSAEYEGLTDDRGHAMAVLTGLAEPDQYPAIRKVFSSQQHASPYMEKYVLEALFEMNYTDDAIQRMKSRFAPMVNSPLTTLWEGWGVGSEGFGGGSYNHAWSGGPLILISQRIAGIHPLEAGYKRFGVKPQVGSLKLAKASVSTVSGEIIIQIEADDDAFNLMLRVPSETQAQVTIPRKFSQELSVNGKSTEASNHQLDLSEGDWEIKAQRQ